jgi:hypothetical protein
MRETTPDLPLEGIVLADARTGRPVEPAGWAGVRVVSLIRHRH